MSFPERCYWQEDRGSYYSGSKTIKERGFKVGNIVSVGASYSQPRGTIVELSNNLPFKAFVRLDSNSGGSTSCWIDSRNLR
jgi:hypothetical protein